MKQITINNETFFYKTFSYHGEHKTEFWKGSKKTFRRKYIFFGPIIESSEPDVLFTIYNDSDSPYLTKSWWRDEINKRIETLKRKEQLKKGELI